MRFFPFKSWILVAAIAASSCTSRPPVEFSTFEEPADPAIDSTANWNNVPAGLQASWTSTHVRFNKSSIPTASSDQQWNGTAWKGERISAQIVLWSATPVNQTEFEFSEFIAPDGTKLSANIAQARFERFVLTDEFAGGCGHRKPENFAASLAADMLDTLKSFNLEAKTVRPVWITIDVPADAQPGTYESTLQLFAERKKHSAFKLKLEVLPQTLPSPQEWKFHLDLWQNPYAVARFHQVAPWSDEHFNYLRPLMQMLSDAGQKAITVSLNKRPWGGQTEDAFDAMIGWTKKQDGSWQYDYSIFDRWVNFMMDLGINKQISCYSMVPWGNEFYYFDEQQNQEVKIKAAPGSPEYAAFWTPFLKDFRLHVQEKGWSQLILLAMDERSPEEMKAMLKLLADVAPEFGVSLADNHKSYKLYTEQLKDISVAHGAIIDPEDMASRRSKGMISTYYVCCSDRFPNVFTFSPPAEGVYIGWYALAADFDGFLRWAYNSWVINPLVDSRFRTWPAGDTYIVYPDARSSVRFETLREGIEDAEKIRLLREQFTANSETEKLQLLNETVAGFNLKEIPQNPEEMIDRAQKILNDLSR